MILTHCLLNVFRNHDLDRPAGPLQNFREGFLLLDVKGLQDIMLRSHLFTRSSDPQANPHKTRIAKMINNGHQTPMAAVTTTLLQADRFKGQIQVVMNHNDVA